MNRIYIENFCLISKHGYYKEEHFKPQRFIISAYCDIGENKSSEHDNLKETFNYEIIRKVIQEEILGEHKKLLETLCENIAKRLLKYGIVEKVEVKISKPDIWGDSSPGVHIVRC